MAERFAQFGGDSGALYGNLYGNASESASTSVWHFGIAGKSAGNQNEMRSGMKMGQA